ncbi:MAG TPA: sulfatase-like hydrolase/transferase [Ruminococcus sp.]|nr:sulfatase-like hydrolase/transferase [Ruminococcus sp.]
MAEKSKEIINSEIENETNAAADQMADVNDAVSNAGDTEKENTKKVKFARLKKFMAKRATHTDKYKKINLFLLLIYPLFIMSIAEITQGKGFARYFRLWGDHTGAMTFGLIITAAVFILLLCIFKHGWAAVAIQSVLFMSLATTELFKYNTNGNHLIISDMRVAKSVKSLKSFAYIKITPQLILSYIIVIAFIALVFYFNPKLKAKPIPRTASVAVCVLVGFGMIVCPPFYKPVYSFFKVDTTSATNDFLLKEKFNNNGFFTFLVQTASENFANRLKEPEDYTKDHIKQILNINVEDDNDFNGGKKPNVIVVMSESWADFRIFDQLDINEDVYKYFDEACEEGHGGRIITPTYASWTVRSEFELMFGLPVRGLYDPNMPQRELADRTLPAMAQYYDSWGYNTAYVHPFQANFYSRNKIYPRFGFKNMIFHDDYDGTTDFTVDVDHYGTYVDDKSIFDQLVDLVKTSDDPIYIHTTTMQNHQPYNQGEDPDAEFDNYLQWIQHSNEGLHTFLEDLKKIDEPTLVFFVGDHFPSLRGETSVYNELGLTGNNCNILYEQSYFLWANYDADFSKVPEEKYSFFYVPYVLLDIIDAPHDAFIEKMMNYMKKMPIYSTSYEPDTPHDKDLDMLTYDRVVGKLYSTSPVTDD